MDDCESDKVVAEVLDWLIDVASGQIEESKTRGRSCNDVASADSRLDLSDYESKCVVDVDDLFGFKYYTGNGDGRLFPHVSSSFQDVPLAANPIDWKTLLESNESYITHWNFYPESSVDLLNLQPHEMCENWDESEDKRRKVYWASGGLIQERYIRTLFREPDTPDEARPTLARVPSDEMRSGPVPHVSTIAASRRLPSGVSKPRVMYKRRIRCAPELNVEENERKLGKEEKKKKPFLKRLTLVIHSTFKKMHRKNKVTA